MFKMDEFKPLNPYLVVRLKRNRHDPLAIGMVRLHWVAEPDGPFNLIETGHWLLTANHGTISKHLPENIDRATLNNELEAWCKVHAFPAQPDLN